MITTASLASTPLFAQAASPPGPEAHGASAGPRGNDLARFTAIVDGDADMNNFALAPARAGTPIASAVAYQSDLFRNMLDAVQKGQLTARTGTPAEMSAASIDIVLKASMSSMHFSACTSLVQSMKSGVQTLMKNQ